MSLIVPLVFLATVLGVVAISLSFLVIVVHELGHLAMAVASGIPVAEFRVGTPSSPLVARFMLGGVTYSFHAYPGGGRVSMHRLELKGLSPASYEIESIEDEENEVPYTPISLRTLLLVAIGGPASSFLFGLACIWAFPGGELPSFALVWESVVRSASSISTTAEVPFSGELLGWRLVSAFSTLLGRLGLLVGFMNILTAALTLTPFPLDSDGGLIVRVLVSSRKNPPRKAVLYTIYVAIVAIAVTVNIGLLIGSSAYLGVAAIM